VTPERIVFAVGDRLLARDLAAAEAREAAFHALHVRALHRTWGVALGYAVAASADGRAVLIGPGLAYDPCGTPLVLARPERVPLPAGVTDGDRRLAAAARPGGGGPRWCWLEPQGRASAAVPVAEVTVGGGQLAAAPVAGARPVAASPVRIGGGRLTLARTSSAFATVAVDTAHAGFAGTPYYFAQVAGPQAGIGLEPGALEPVLGIRDERPRGFTLDVRRLGPRMTAGAPVPVAWIGVETHVPTAVPLTAEDPEATWCT
jgi:hypothetical protein